MADDRWQTVTCDGMHAWQAGSRTYNQTSHRLASVCVVIVFVIVFVACGMWHVTHAGYMLARKYYGEEMASGSIPAAEHSTITSWGRDHELDAFKNMLTSFPTGLVRG